MRRTTIQTQSAPVSEPNVFAAAVQLLKSPLFCYNTPGNVAVCRRANGSGVWSTRTHNENTLLSFSLLRLPYFKCGAGRFNFKHRVQVSFLFFGQCAVYRNTELRLPSY